MTNIDDILRELQAEGVLQIKAFKIKNLYT